ncbi:hypothetical protein [Sphingomonas sp. CFBP 13733]|uniref:hypothetical protein n=1 Tax=Sphingomonas sp. CFBP 13733 TaxID=2775291 RepID=UPI00177FA55E|nr:hypothetical protein [Sphingomonas sp. CFBP 13733]MBD8641116.1 hypothetical protein [Sphingomonas sp. CFBP 13733]
MHRRLPEVREVHIPTLKTDPTFVFDNKLVSTYAALNRGEVKVGVTRMATTEIHAGFFRREADGSITHVQNLKKSRTSGLTEAIRNGLRPSLDLQWSPHAPGGGGYVCADDEYSLAAYRDLNIAVVPCRVLRPKPILGSEAALWIEPKGKLPKLVRTIPPELVAVATYFGGREVGPAIAIPHLRERCEATMARIEVFHKDEGYDVHYHQMLHAVVRRHARALDTIQVLIGQGRREHGLAICRLAYEAFLNFYLDWLAPQLIGPRLQLIAALRQKESATNRGKDPAWDMLTNFTSLLEKTSEKARLSPLGDWFHDAIYHSLSLVVHQSYSELELEAGNFAHDVEQSQENFSDRRLVQCLDMLTAALLTRVSNEVGGPEKVRGFDEVSDEKP